MKTLFESAVVFGSIYVLSWVILHVLQVRPLYWTCLDAFGVIYIFYGTCKFLAWLIEVVQKKSIK